MGEDETAEALESEAADESSAIEEVREAARVAPSEVRTQFRRDVGANYPKMRATLERTMSAKTERSVTCRGCGRKNAVTIDDGRVQLEAVRLFHELGFGKPQAQEDDQPVELPPDITKLSHEERKELRARLYKLARPEVRRAIYGDILDRGPARVRARVTGGAGGARRSAK